MIKCIDGTGHEVVLPGPAKRIISLVPSQTEWLAYLGLDEEVQGITKFCTHPGSWRRRKTVVGGTKSVHFERIHGLQPDLIIGNKEENTQEIILELRDHYPCYTSDVLTFENAWSMMRDIGLLTGKWDAANSFAEQCQGLAERIEKNVTNRYNKKVAYVIWMDPLMVVGSGTYIDHMLTALGYTNAFGSLPRYPMLTTEDWAQAAPELILLSSEPFPFKKVHLDYFQRSNPGADVRLVDGELFSWYGWRMAKALTILPELRQNLLSN